MRVANHYPPFSKRVSDWGQKKPGLGPVERKQFTTGLLLRAFDVSRDALVVEHGSGPHGEGVLPADYHYRVLIDFQFYPPPREKSQTGELRLSGEAADTEQLIQEHVAPLDWPTEVKAIVWYDFFYFLGRYVTSLPSVKSTTGLKFGIVPKTINRTLRATFDVLTEDGLFIAVEGERSDADLLRARVEELALPYRSLTVFEPWGEINEVALVFEK